MRWFTVLLNYGNIYHFSFLELCGKDICSKSYSNIGRYFQPSVGIIIVKNKDENTELKIKTLTLYQRKCLARHLKRSYSADY